MTTIDISQMGNLLNMSNVFSMYMTQLHKCTDRKAQYLLADLRQALNKQIQHTSYEQINNIMQELVKITSRYSVLTRIDLGKALERANPYQLLTASALEQDQGFDLAMIYLLHPHGKPNYKGKDLLKRFGIIDSSEK